MASIVQVLELIEFRFYSGTTSFYSNPELSALLGFADRITVNAVVNESTGTSPALTVVAEDSADGENWADVNTVINAANISSPPLTLGGSVTYPHGRFLRFRITLGGTSPTATMSLRATLRLNDLRGTHAMCTTLLDGTNAPGHGMMCTTLRDGPGRIGQRMRSTLASFTPGDPRIDSVELVRRARRRLG
jgi:hypothetical protein